MEGCKSMSSKYEGTAIIISLIAIGISLWSTFLSSNANDIARDANASAEKANEIQSEILQYEKDRDQTERISLRFIRYGFDSIIEHKYVSFNSDHTNTKQGILPANYIIYISNASNRNVSIIDYELFDNNNGIQRSINDTINNYIDLEELFPITLQPNETKKITLKINTVVSSMTNVKLKSEPTYRLNTSQEIIDILKNLDSDIWEKQLINEEYSYDDLNFPEFRLHIITSEDNLFTLDFSAGNVVKND